MNQTLITKKNILKYRTVGPVSVFLPQQEANHIFIIMDFMHSVPKSNILYTHFFDELKLKNNIVKSRNLIGIKPERLDVSLCLKLL